MASSDSADEGNDGEGPFGGGCEVVDGVDGLSDGVLFVVGDEELEHVTVADEFVGEFRNTLWDVLFDGVSGHGFFIYKSKKKVVIYNNNNNKTLLRREDDVEIDLQNESCVDQNCCTNNKRK